MPTTGLRYMFFTGVLAATCQAAAPPMELELATERGVQITAPHEWLQLLTEIGIDRVRIRGMQTGDAPQVVNRGSAEEPRYFVLGLLTSRDQLRLPGGTFSRSNRAALKDYFDRLRADGAESLTAERSRFGLTDKEFAAVTADLVQPIDFETKDQLPSGVIERLQRTFALRIALDPDAALRLRAAAPFTDSLTGITAGTGLAIMLRSYGLVLRPEKSRGQPVVFRISLAGTIDLSDDTAGKTDDNQIKHWPIGWAPADAPGKIAPSLFEPRNAEIDGYTLEETLAAIQPRLKVALYLDHAALAAKQIDPATIQVRLARTRSSYKRIIDRVVSQARLGAQLRVDEAGTPFLWITR